MNIFSIDPVAFNLFSRPIYWYGIIISATIFLGYYIAEREAKKRNLQKDTMLDLLIISVPAAILSARLYYVLFRWDYYVDNKNKILAIWDGGLAVYGGLLGGLITLIFFAKKKNINIIKMLDIIAPSLLLGQMIGRWGNFFNQEAYGEIVSKNYLENMYIPNFVIENMLIDGHYRQPTFFYESVWCGIAFLIVIFIRKHLYVGEVLASYLVLYGIERFFVEGMRVDSLYLGSLRISQVLSIFMVILGLYIFIRNRIIIKNQTKYIAS